MAQAMSFLPLLFGLVAIVGVFFYPKKAMRPRVAIAMGVLVILISAGSAAANIANFARWLPAGLIRHQSPTSQASKAAILPKSFEGDLVGTLVRAGAGAGDEDSSASWQIESTINHGMAGSLEVSLFGQATRNRGLNVDHGTVSLRSQGGAVCDGTVITIRNNHLTANCSQVHGRQVTLEVQFEVGKADAITGHLSGSAESAASTLPPTPTASQPTQARVAKGHVFVIVMENRSYWDALATPYISSLAKTYGVATNYHSVSEPSLPNYLAMTSGNTWNIHDDNYHSMPANGLGQQLSRDGVSWKAYAEGLTGDCFASPYPYALKHNPFAYYGGTCPANVVPISQLPGDLRSNTPALTWIMPGLCNDCHDCSRKTADAWLAQVVPSVLASPAWREGGVLLITWDEGGTATDDHVATLVISPNLVAHESATYYTHYSLLATIEDHLGVGRLGQAAGATPMTDLVR